MFTCSRCSFHHGFKWIVDEHIDTNMTPRGKIPCPPTILRVGADGGGRAPTTVSVPPIKRHGLQSGLGVEYEDSESEHGDTDEETVDDVDLHEETENDDDDEMDADNGEGDGYDGDGDDVEGVDQWLNSLPVGILLY